jgi:lysozyme
MMKTSQRGIELIQLHEGCRLCAYVDPGSGGLPITIGYGHTSGVKLGMRITQEQAAEFLAEDLKSFEDVVNEHVKVEINQHQFDALVSFTFNIGPRNFIGSSVLSKLNDGDKQGAADALLLWDRAAHHVMPGLLHRRQDERKLFLEGA